MDKKIRKQVGELKSENVLDRVYALSQFMRLHNLKAKDEENIKPIRKVVGRSSS